MSVRKEQKLDQLCVNTLRMLAVDMVERAKSGHPGLPLGAAPSAYVLWTRIMRYNPANPHWFNRDRFILSAGHGAALLYALLHLTGYDLPLEELKRFRQWQSKTPGHPEYGCAPGVEATTGPLGQGFAMAVGMALAERILSDCHNAPDLPPLIDHNTYILASDGDLMEGISSEAASLAATMRLNKLICLYDDNHITIEGQTDLAFTENVQQRFQAYGWQVFRVHNGNNLESIEAAMRSARHEQEKPSLIIIRTHIGYGSPKQDTAEAHGEPLGLEHTLATKRFFQWPLEPSFYIPDEAVAIFKQAQSNGQRDEKEWLDLLCEYRQKYPAETELFEKQIVGQLPADWDAEIPVFSPNGDPIATRAASGKIMNAIAGRLPNFLGGSADLAPSTKTQLIGYGDLGYAHACSRNIHFGVREHAMAAIVNGMALHGGLIPYTGTFLIFSDYMRPALRLAAMMNVPAIFVFSHDSIGLGEDGPTHQPVEQLTSLRAMPNMTLIRPADANETAAAWRVAITRRKPVALALTRQNLPILDTNRFSINDGVTKGGYVLLDGGENPRLILIATGSEVHLALAAAEELSKQEISACVVSLPSWELFAEQTKEYQDKVLPPHIKTRLAIEAGATLGWYKWVGDVGAVIGVDTFGTSAPGAEVMRHYGFTVENVVAQALKLLEKTTEVRDTRYDHL